MTDSWNRLLSLVSHPLHDISISNRTKGAADIAIGVSEIAAAVSGGPEVIAAEIGFESIVLGARIAKDVVSGTANLVAGTIEGLSGRDLGDFGNVAKNPIHAGDAVDIAEGISGALSADGLERIRGWLTITEKIFEFSQDREGAKDREAGRNQSDGSSRNSSDFGDKNLPANIGNTDERSDTPGTLA